MFNDLDDRVRRIVASAGRIPVESVELNRSLAELGLDSLEALTLAFQLEDQLRIKIPDDCLDREQPVRALIDRLAILLPQNPVRAQES